MNTPNAPIACAALAAAAALSSAQVLDINAPLSASSGITAELCQDAPILGGCATDSSPITGFVRVRYDEANAMIALTSFQGASSESLDYSYSGLFSSLDASLTTVDASPSTASPTPEVPVNPDGSFVFPGLSVDLIGSGTAVGSVFGIVDLNETIDLADFSPVTVDVAGVITESGGTYTIDLSFEFMGSGVVEPTVPITASVDATVTLVGSATADCAASVDGDSDADVFDILAFLGAWSGGDLAADYNGSGTLDIFDVLIFLDIWNLGC